MSRNEIFPYEIVEAIRAQHSMYRKRRKIKVATIIGLLVVWAGLMAWLLGLVYLF